MQAAEQSMQVAVLGWLLGEDGMDVAKNQGVNVQVTLRGGGMMDGVDAMGAQWPLTAHLDNQRAKTRRDVARVQK